MEAIARPVSPTPAVTTPAAETPVMPYAPQLDLTEETPKVTPRRAAETPAAVEPPRVEPAPPKPARDSAKVVVRGQADSARRPVSPRSSQPVAVVKPTAKWDWEKTLAIGLLTLGTVIVVMIGVWLFGANQNGLSASTDSTNSTAAQTSERSGNGPQ
jgi:hypothetical protein